MAMISQLELSTESSEREQWLRGQSVQLKWRRLNGSIQNCKFQEAGKKALAYACASLSRTEVCYITRGPKVAHLRN